MDEIRQQAMRIVELFEDLLEEHGMVIPDSDRTGAEGEAPIYGVTYGNLVDDVQRLLIGDMEVGGTDAEGICPVCRAKFIYGYFELVDEGGVYEWNCPRCGATGREGYDMTFDGNQYDVKLADGRPFKREEQPDGED